MIMRGKVVMIDLIETGRGVAPRRSRTCRSPDAAAVHHHAGRRGDDTVGHQHHLLVERRWALDGRGRDRRALLRRRAGAIERPDQTVVPVGAAYLADVPQLLVAAVGRMVGHRGSVGFNVQQQLGRRLGTTGNAVGEDGCAVAGVMFTTGPGRIRSTAATTVGATVRRRRRRRR